MRILKCSFLFLLFAGSYLFGQIKEITVQNGSDIKKIPAYEREGLIYISVKPFADLLSLPYKYDSVTGKIEITGFNKILQVTSKNPFIVIYSADKKKKEVIQLPTSAYYINENIYIPLKYSLKILSDFIASTITYEAPNKLFLQGLVLPPKKEIKSKFDITAVTLDEKVNGTLVRFKCTKEVPSYSSIYKNDILTLTFRKVLADTVKIGFTGGKGLIKSMKVRNVKGDAVFSLLLRKEYTANEVIADEKSSDIILTLHNKLYAGNGGHLKAKWNFDVIVLDAGHGGKDAGALGVNGVKEKDIALGITLKLGKLIEENLPEVKVKYTRSSDTFVELYRRGKIANDADGKLFVSIHCNSTPKKPSNATGFEVYLLRPGRTQEAISIAERENSVIEYESDPKRYQKLTDENFILVSMAHSAYMKYSEKFSEYLDTHFSNRTRLASRGVKQAGFYVLVGASMPSVLIETGFLSNKSDADYLKSSKGQQEIAEAIFQGIKNFRDFYNKQIDGE